MVVYIDDWFINHSTLIQHCSQVFLVSSISSISSSFFQFIPISSSLFRNKQVFPPGREETSFFQKKHNPGCAFKSYYVTAPEYLCNLVFPYVQSRSLLSCDQCLMTVPGIQLKSYGERTLLQLHLNGINFHSILDMLLSWHV